MVDETLVNRAAAIERCVRRAREEYVQSLLLPIVVAVITERLEDFLALSAALLAPTGEAGRP